MQEIPVQQVIEINRNFVKLVNNKNGLQKVKSTG